MNHHHALALLNFGGIIGWTLLHISGIVHPLVALPMIVLCVIGVAGCIWMEEKP